MVMKKPKGEIGRLKLLMENGRVEDAILYCHFETVIVAGAECYLLKTTPADYTGVSFTRSLSSTGRYMFSFAGIFGAFYFQLTGVAKILAATIYGTYRARHDASTGVVHCDIRISVFTNLGALRTLIADGVSDSANLTTTWTTYTGANYSFAEYTVVDQADWLVISYYAHITTSEALHTAYLRIDDNTLAVADQTRSQDWSFQAPPPPAVKAGLNVPQALEIILADEG